MINIKQWHRQGRFTGALRENSYRNILVSLVVLYALSGIRIELRLKAGEEHSGVSNVSKIPRKHGRTQEFAKGGQV